MPEDYLKDFIKLAETIYDNSEELVLKPLETWNKEILRKEWFRNNGHEDKYITQSPGWYWIACDINFEELKQVYCPTQYLRGKACRIGELSKKNYKTFGKEYLCKTEDDDRQIIYNGHQQNVIIRLRQHFFLNNDRTGALGLNCYPLSHKSWKVRFFGRPHIKRLSSGIQSEVRDLIEEQSGRLAIENAWRAKYGWPILCKA